MFCPKCGAEYVEGKEHCPDCDVDLVPEPTDPHAAEEQITILETSNSTLIPVIKSVLAANEIPYTTEGEAMMNLFPSEALGALLHQSAGELVIKVPKSRVQEARDLLDTHAEIEMPDELRSDSEAGDSGAAAEDGETTES